MGLHKPQNIINLEKSIQKPKENAQGGYDLIEILVYWFDYWSLQEMYYDWIQTKQYQDWMDRNC